MQYKCSVCGETVNGGSLVYIQHTERHIIDLIKSRHPEWEEKDGICPKCVAYLRRSIKGEG